MTDLDTTRSPLYGYVPYGDDPRPWEIALTENDVSAEQWAISCYTDCPVTATYALSDALTAIRWRSGHPCDYDVPELFPDEQSARAAFAARYVLCPTCGCGVERARMSDPARCPNCAYYAARTPGVTRGTP